jgi:hypothetical protein
MVLAAVARGWRIEEVPVRYRRRIGQSKVTGTVRGTLTAVADMRRQLDAWKAHDPSVLARHDPGVAGGEASA